MNLKRLFRYENSLLFILSFIFGFVLLDRMALSFLVPFFDKEFGLDNTQIGLLNSLLALAWAVSGYLTGALSDKRGKRKKYLLIAITVFSTCSFISGLATSFVFLLLARIMMGFAEGPVLPIAQSILMGNSSARRRSFNMGFMQTFISNLFAAVAPLVLVKLAVNVGWRSAFFIAGVPGLILAALGYFYIKEPTAAGLKEKKRKHPLLFYSGTGMYGYAFYSAVV